VRTARCTTDDLIALAASGYRAGALLIDPPWPFATWSHRGLAGDTSQENRRPRSRAVPYRTMSHEDIYKLPVGALAAEDCVLFLCVVQTQLDKAFECVRHWDFELRSVAFAWFKGEQADDDPADIHVPMGNGYWTRAGFEQIWIATRGNPRRLHADVRQVIIEPRREHSRKPDCVHERIARLVRGPYVELFARPTSPGLIRPGWTCWGDEIPRGQFREAPAEPEPPPPREAAPTPHPLDIPEPLSAP
jgi:N6-adenosine-specific RNA methylase IME4